MTNQANNTGLNAGGFPLAIGIVMVIVSQTVKFEKHGYANFSFDPSNPNGRGLQMPTVGENTELKMAILIIGLIFFVIGIVLISQSQRSRQNARSVNTNPTSNNSSTTPNNMYAELEKLASLKEKGIITEDEFTKMKASILNKS